MSNSCIKLIKSDRLLVVELGLPPDRRQTPTQIAAEFADRCAEIRWDKEIRVIVLTYQVETYKNLEADSDDRCDIEPISLVETVAELHQPTIAAIKGDAIGFGLELALACDLRYASTSSRFGLPHIMNGIIPSEGGTQRLPRLVGRAKALEMLLTGELLDATEACRLGIVSKVMPSDELMASTIKIASDMAAKGPVALSYVKEAVLKGMDMTLEQALRLEADLYFLLHSTEDRREGIKAFKEKKMALFKGQ